MDYQHIVTEDADGVHQITINREDKMNAINIRLLGEIKHAVEQAYMDPDIKGVIITGKGDKAFAAGADIEEFADYSKEQAEEMSKGGHEILNLIERCPKPVIAVVNGFALGGGCELAMACHMRLASPDAQFGQPEVNLGIIPGYGGTQRFIQLAGKGKAMELLTTGNHMSAEEAQRVGLVNHVYEKGQLIEEAVELIKKISQKAPLAIEKIVKCVSAYYNVNEDGFATEIEEFSKSMETNDFKEGTDAFLNKRKPAFKGE